MGNNLERLTAISDDHNALKYVEGWTDIGQCRRHGKKPIWWCRHDQDGVVLDGLLWGPAPAEDETDDEIEDLLG